MLMRVIKVGNVHVSQQSFYRSLKTNSRRIEKFIHIEQKSIYIVHVLLRFIVKEKVILEEVT